MSLLIIMMFLSTLGNHFIAYKLVPADYASTIVVLNNIGVYLHKGYNTLIEQSLILQIISHHYYIN